MWLSKRMISAGPKKNPALGEVTHTNSSNIDVQTSNEHREISMIAPFGLASVPNNGDNCVVLPVTDERVCLGVKMPDQNLNSGEIKIYSGAGAYIILRSDGSVDINGVKVRINGREV